MLWPVINTVWDQYPVLATNMGLWSPGPTWVSFPGTQIPPKDMIKKMYF